MIFMIDYMHFFIEIPASSFAIVINKLQVQSLDLCFVLA